MRNRRQTWEELAAEWREAAKNMRRVLGKVKRRTSIEPHAHAIEAAEDLIPQIDSGINMECLWFEEAEKELNKKRKAAREKEKNEVPT